VTSPVTSPVAQRISHVDHVGIAVPSIEAAAPLYVDVLGGELLSGGDNLATGLRLVHLRFPGFKLELMESRRPDSLIAPWLERSGPGLHHITFFVDDIPRTVGALEAAGVRTVGTATASANWSETFLHPADTGGPLLQMVASARRWDVREEGFDLADVLAGRIIWDDFVPCRVEEPVA
jgi:methylmalonyl-CoA/ethylmalonyl-CoA epimerase